MRWTLGEEEVLSRHTCNTCRFVRDHNSLFNSCVYLRQSKCEPWIMSYRSPGVDVYKYVLKCVILERANVHDVRG